VTLSPAFAVPLVPASVENVHVSVALFLTVRMPPSFDSTVPVSLKPYAGVDALYAPRRTILDPAATHHPLSVWDDGARDFVVVPGEHTVFVGASSEDTPLTATVTIG